MRVIPLDAATRLPASFRARSDQHVDVAGLGRTYLCRPERRGILRSAANRHTALLDYERGACCGAVPGRLESFR